MTEIVSAITALFVLATAVLSFLNRKNIEKVHVLVNSRLTAVVNRVTQLTELLEAKGIDVPEPHPEKKPKKK